MWSILTSGHQSNVCTSWICRCFCAFFYHVSSLWYPSSSEETLQIQASCDCSGRHKHIKSLGKSLNRSTSIPSDPWEPKDIKPRFHQVQARLASATSMSHHKSSQDSIVGCFWEPNMQKDRELVDKEAGTLRVFQQCLVGSKCLQKSSCVGWVVHVYIWAILLPVPLTSMIIMVFYNFLLSLLEDTYQILTFTFHG